jgi:hypothetical protein
MVVSVPESVATPTGPIAAAEFRVVRADVIVRYVQQGSIRLRIDLPIPAIAIDRYRQVDSLLSFNETRLTPWFSQPIFCARA